MTQPIPGPINLYRQGGDREVWERAQKEADEIGYSLSRHVVAVLREPQEMADQTAQNRTENTRRAELNRAAREGRESADPVERAKWAARDEAWTGSL